MTTHRTTDQLTDAEFSKVMTMRQSIANQKQYLNQHLLMIESSKRQMLGTDPANLTLSQKITANLIKKYELDLNICELIMNDYYAQIFKIHEFPPVPGSDAEKAKKKRGRKSKVAESA
jgi:hypothetical protein